MSNSYPKKEDESVDRIYDTTVHHVPTCYPSMRKAHPVPVQVEDLPYSAQKTQKSIRREKQDGARTNGINASCKGPGVPARPLTAYSTISPLGLFCCAHPAAPGVRPNPSHSHMYSS